MNHTRAVIVWRMVLAGLAIIGSVACLVPSAMMNIRVRQEMGGDLSVALACIAAVALAAACVIVAENAWKNQQYQRLVWCAPVFAVLFAFNISNAIGLAGADRSAFTEPRTAAVQTLHSLRARLETMKDERGPYRITAGGSTPDLAKSTLSLLELPVLRFSVAPVSLVLLLTALFAGGGGRTGEPGDGHELRQSARPRTAAVLLSFTGTG